MFRSQAAGRVPCCTTTIKVRWMRQPTSKTEERSWWDFAPAIALLIISAVGIFVSALSPTGDRGQYAVVAPPWYNLTQTIGLVAAAGGDIVDFGGIAAVIIVHSEHPGFIRALYHAGAWLVFDPVGLRGCLGFARDVPRTSGDV
jgi:hypothetical protein